MADTKLTLKQLEERTNKNGQHDRSFVVILSDLKMILMRDGTRERAIRHARISKDTFYRWLDESDEFMDEIEKAEDYAHNLAERVIIEKIEEGDADMAMKWKDRRDKARYSTKVEQEHSGKVIIRPINYLDTLPKDAPESPKEVL